MVPPRGQTLHTYQTHCPSAPDIHPSALRRLYTLRRQPALPCAPPVSTVALAVPVDPDPAVFSLNRGYDWRMECWKSFERGKQKVSSAVMKHSSQETRTGPDSTFHTIAGQQCNKPCPGKPTIVLEHTAAVENHI
ncbi:hypothetical protein F7725_015568 [Dissostichus mawsoni]|uniref:Uncharacterized protein n=1 Tax=Dissostichus mawsoni TaxID=36200 RepID=A0A7J5YJA1_DISMA|nr:hypothetical protein F7725_015568 [Dissostichus mawsoni]